MQPDHVTLRRGDDSGSIIVTGTVIDYLGTQLTFTPLGTNAIRTYRADEILAVDTPQSEAHARGLVQFTNGELDAAVGSLSSALETETRSWVRREIEVTLMHCALWKGNYAAAGAHFERVLDGDPNTRHYYLVPLVWTKEDVSPELVAAARKWLTDDRPLVRLMGAAALLEDSGMAQTALIAMKQLVIDTDPRIYTLAEAQTWRQSLGAEKLYDQELRRWRRSVEKMPEELRGGPWYLLGRGYRRNREYEQAATSFLWLPTVYDGDRNLTARACLEAAECLAHLGRRAEAIAVFREAAERFAHSRFAQPAEKALDAYSQADGAPASSAASGEPTPVKSHKKDD